MKFAPYGVIYVNTTTSTEAHTSQMARESHICVREYRKS